MTDVIVPSSEWSNLPSYNILSHIPCSVHGRIFIRIFGSTFIFLY